MKRVLLALWLIMASVINVMSQTSHCVVHDEKGNNTVYAYMDPQEYIRLSDKEKTSLIWNLSSQHDAIFVCVICAHDTEMWQLEGGAMKIVDSWNKDSVMALPSNVKKKDNQKRSLQHPWFFNISGSVNVGLDFFNESQSSYNAYGRLGCYLLKGRWDFAINYVLGYSKLNKETEGTYSNSIGLDTRVYILKGKAVNPFAGVGLAYSSSGGESSVTIPVSAGMSIPINGKGCIDACYQYNKVTKSTIIVGYTHMF